MVFNSKACSGVIILFAIIMFISSSAVYAEELKTFDVIADEGESDEGIVEGIKTALPDVPYKNEGILVLFPTYVGMMAGGLVGLPLGMVIVLPAGIVGSGIVPLVLYETGNDPVSENPVPTGTKLAVMGAKPIIYLSYGVGYVVGFPFLAVKKIVWDLPKSLFYDPFHQDVNPATSAVK
jgi:hypothetical protein